MLLYSTYGVPLPGVTIGFEETSYETPEGVAVEVCVILMTPPSATLDRDVVVTIASSDGTATCKAMHFKAFQ